MSILSGSSPFFVNVVDTAGNVVTLPDKSYVVEQITSLLVPLIPPLPSAISNEGIDVWSPASNRWLTLRDQEYIDQGFNNCFIQGKAYTDSKIEEALINSPVLEQAKAYARDVLDIAISSSKIYTDSIADITAENASLDASRKDEELKSWVRQDFVLPSLSRVADWKQDVVRCIIDTKIPASHIYDFDGVLNAKKWDINSQTTGLLTTSRLSTPNDPNKILRGDGTWGDFSQDVNKNYVDSQDLSILNQANNYTDSKSFGYSTPFKEIGDLVYSIEKSDYFLGIETKLGKSLISLPLSPIKGKTYKIMDSTGDAATNPVFYSGNIRNKENSTPILISELDLEEAQRTIEITPDGNYVYVGSRFGHEVSIIEDASSANPKLLKKIDVGFTPEFISITPDGNYVYVSHSEVGKITLIKDASTSNPTILKIIETGLEYSGSKVVITPDGNYAYFRQVSLGRLLMLHNVSNDNADILKTVNVDWPYDFITSLNGKYGCVQSGYSTISIFKDISSENPTLIANISLEDSVYSMTLTPDGNTLYVVQTAAKAITVISGISSEAPIVLMVISFNTYPDTVFVTPDGEQAFVINSGSNFLTVIQGASTLTPGIVKSLNVANQTTTLVMPKNGEYAYLVSRGANKITFLKNISTQDVSVFGSVDITGEPWNINTTPNGNFIYTSNRSNGKISVLGICGVLINQPYSCQELVYTGEDWLASSDFITNTAFESRIGSLTSIFQTMIDAVTPIGTVIPWFSNTIPSNFLLCDGSAVQRAQYLSLFLVIGTNCGAGNGTTTFNLPDLRGRFLRGYDQGSGADPDATSRTCPGKTNGNGVGTYQGHSLYSHNHQISSSAATVDVNYYAAIQTGSTLARAGNVIQDGGWFIGSSSEISGGSETRPKNIACNFIIRYK